MRITKTIGLVIVFLLAMIGTSFALTESQAEKMCKSATKSCAYGVDIYDLNSGSTKYMKLDKSVGNFDVNNFQIYVMLNAKDFDQIINKNMIDRNIEFTTKDGKTIAKIGRRVDKTREQIKQEVYGQDYLQSAKVTFNAPQLAFAWSNIYNEAYMEQFKVQEQNPKPDTSCSGTGLNGAFNALQGCNPAQLATGTYKEPSIKG